MYLIFYVNVIPGPNTPTQVAVQTRTQMTLLLVPYAMGLA